MRLWRISEFAELSGEGAKTFPGRWNEGGVPIVYCSDHPSTSLLEILVHVDREDLPRSYQLLEIFVPDGIGFFEFDLPHNWQSLYETTRQIGTKFLTDLQHPLMRIPSIIMPQAFNFLINPAHPQAAAITIGQTWRYPFDSRLLV